MRWKIWKIFFWAEVWLCMFLWVPVQAEENSGASEGITAEIIGDMDFVQIQCLLDEALGKNSFSFTEALKGLVRGDEVFSKEAVQEFVYSLFFNRMEQEKDTLFRVLLLVLIGAVFANFVSVFDNGQIGEVSFYMVYLLLFIILMDSFRELSDSLASNLNWMTDFMKGLSPAYFIAVTAASGTASASVFYQGVLLLVWLVQWILLSVLLPGVNLYTLMRLVNHLSREDMLGKMAELLLTAIGWGLRTLLGMVVGLQVVRGLIAPVIDSLKRTAIGKTASAIPAVGNAINMVTELVFTSAVLVKNCLGAAALVVFVLVGASPVIHYGMISLAYRFLAAVAQPVSDKRMVGCLSTMGEGCALLLRILLTAEVLFMLTIVILMASFGGSV